MTHVPFSLCKVIQVHTCATCTIGHAGYRHKDFSISRKNIRLHVALPLHRFDLNINIGSGALRPGLLCYILVGVYGILIVSLFGTGGIAGGPDAWWSTGWGQKVES